MKLYELQGIEKIHKNENPTNKQRDGTSDQDNYAGMTEKMVFNRLRKSRELAPELDSDYAESVVSYPA